MRCLIKKILIISTGDVDADIPGNGCLIIFRTPLLFEDIESIEELKANLIVCFNEIFIENVDINFSYSENEIPSELINVINT